MADRSQEDEIIYWEKVSRESTMVAISKCEEAAKQLITLNSLIATFYVSLISFSDIIKQSLVIRSSLLFIIFPLPFWLISLVFATRVIVPQSHKVGLIKDDYMKIGQNKLTFLQWSYVFLIISIITLIVVIAIYLLYVPTPAV